MSDYESVNKIKSLKQCIEQATKESYDDLTAAIQALKNGYGSSIEGGSGGSSSGIIDVTELPTSGIDENAVYRLTESMQIAKNDIWVYDGSYYTVQGYLNLLGVTTIPNIYVVDDLSNMLTTDVQTFSAVNIYILRSDGTAYLNVPAYGGIITCGLFAFQTMGYDKGFTENIYNETNKGIYTTLETFKDVVRYFIRENGKWKEITAYTTYIASHGSTIVSPLSGYLVTPSDIISGNVTEIDEGWYIRPNGERYRLIKDRFFANAKLKTADIPYFIYNVEPQAFYSCHELTKVTFKGTPAFVNSDVFKDCPNLTIINVPWSEGEVGVAPWGATNATINYNYTGG